MSSSFPIRTTNLARGLRPSKRVARNGGFLVECNGAIGRDGVLQIMDELTRMDTDTITDSFPYPNVFVFPKLIVVCGQTKIYEWVNSALVLKLTVSSGQTWRYAEFQDYIYMSNVTVSVERDPITKLWALSDQPTASAIWNFNNQIHIGSPG